MPKVGVPRAESMARLGLWLLLPLLRASGSRQAEFQSRALPRSMNSGPSAWRAASGLSATTVWQVLALIPHPHWPPVAWSRAGHASVLRGAEHLDLDLGDGNFIHSFWPLGDRVLTRIWAPAGATLWHVRTGRALWTLQGKILDAEAFPDGERVATLSDDGTVVVRDAVSGDALHHLVSRHPGKPRRLLLLGDCQLVTWGGPGAPATIWHLPSGRSWRHWTPSGRGVRKLVASP